MGTYSVHPLNGAPFSLCLIPFLLTVGGSPQGLSEDHLWGLLRKDVLVLLETLTWSFGEEGISESLS